MKITRKQLGVSLIELMVALVIGVFLIGGAVTVYLQSTDSHRTSERVARIQEVGRYAMDLLSADIQHAGYWGTAYNMDGASGSGSISSSVPAGTVSIDCGGNWLADASSPLQATDSAPVGVCTESTRYAGADSLMIRRANRTVTTPNAAIIQVESTRTAAEIHFTGTQKYASGSTVRDLIVHSYYITQTGPATFPIYTLRQRTLTQAAVGMDFNARDLITGIQDMQIELGLDTDNDGFADRYVNPPAAAGTRIVTVRLWLLLVGDEQEQGYVDSALYSYANRNFVSAFTDGRRRILISKTIAIRNSHV